MRHSWQRAPASNASTPPGGPVGSCPAPPDAANNKNCAATSCPAPPPDRFKGKKKVKVGTFDPTDIPEPPRKPLRFLKLEDEDDEELELRLSAAEGRADAQYNLGVMFDGQGATADPQEAARNYREAANSRPRLGPIQPREHVPQGVSGWRSRTSRPRDSTKLPVYPNIRRPRRTWTICYKKVM